MYNGDMLRKQIFAAGEIYHLYNRGVDKREIFINQKDFERFQQLLFLCNGDKNIVFRDIPIGRSYGYEVGEKVVDIGAYCLMPNHFHVMVREKVEGGISRFMKKLGTAYSMYFNTKNERSGALFQGRFKSQHVDNEEQLNWLFSYVHLNPVKLIDSKWKERGISDKKKALSYMNNYKYSSYYDWFIGQRPEGAILNKDLFPKHFAKLDDFSDLVKTFAKGETER